jgi:competence protein ComEC
VNDSSVVVLIEVPEFSVLALGDVEPPAQERIAAGLPPEAARADVVKVAHHGSAHQSDRLAELIGPALALVSAGKDNTYGHPAPATVRLYQGVGSLVLSTDRCGPVAVGEDPGGTGVPGALRVTARCLD